MKKLSLSHAWEETRMVLARDGRLFASVALALVVLPQTIIGLLGSASTSRASGMTFALFATMVVVGFAAQIALNRLAIGPSTTVASAIGRGFARVAVLLGSILILIVGMFIVLIPAVLLLGAAGLVTEPSAGQQAPPGLLALIMLVAAFAYAIFQLTVPVAAAESGGSLRLVVRSWQLGRGAYWRLLGFVVLLFVALLVVIVAGQFGLGSIIAVALGPPDPLSLSALAISLVVALLQAVLTVVFAVMLARIYVQLSAAGAAEASVPRSGI